MSEESETPAPDVVSDNRLRLDAPYMKTFFSLLANTLLVSLINFTVWFAITFYVFLQTRSVFAAAMISGIYLVATALTGIWFGSLIDHHRKKTMLQLSAVFSLVMYAAALALYLTTPEEHRALPLLTGAAGFRHNTGAARKLGC